VPGIGVPFMMANTISVAGALLSGLSSYAPGDTRPSGPVDSLLELQSTLPCGVAAPICGGLVRDIVDCENRLRCAWVALGN
jgi:hypothetical protein